MPPMLVDTDVLSAIMRRSQAATEKAAAYLSVHSLFSFSIITRYEILRGSKGQECDKADSGF